MRIRHAWPIVLLLATAAESKAQPSVTGTATDLGGGLTGWRIAIDFSSDGATAAGNERPFKAAEFLGVVGSARTFRSELRSRGGADEHGGKKRDHEEPTISKPPRGDS